MMLHNNVADVENNQGYWAKNKRDKRRMVFITLPAKFTLNFRLHNKNV